MYRIYAIQRRYFLLTLLKKEPYFMNVLQYAIISEVFKAAAYVWYTDAKFRLTTRHITSIRTFHSCLLIFFRK